MPQIAAAEIVSPKQLSAPARQKLADELYDVHSRIFAGVNKQSFVKYVVESTAEHTWILLQKSAQGAVVGYFAVHVFERMLRGKLTAIFRAEAGLLSAYRGNNATMSFGLERVLRYMLAHPGRPALYLGSLVHPSSYAMLSRYADCVYPSPAAETPADIAALMRDLAGEFHLEQVDEANPLVYKVGWQTIDSATDRARWQASANPAVQYFVDANPGFAEGHGLLTVVPVSLGGVMRAGARHAALQAQRWARKHTGYWVPTPATATAAA